MPKSFKSLKRRTRLWVLILFIPVVLFFTSAYLVVLAISMIIKIIDFTGIFDAITYSMNKLDEIFN